MRTVDKNQAPQEFFKYFQEFIAEQRPALIWQLDENSQKRSLRRVALSSARKEEDTLKARALEKNKDFHLPRDDVYFYVASARLMFKSFKVNVEKETYIGRLPNILRVLNDEEHDKIMQALLALEPEKAQLVLDYGKPPKGPAEEREIDYSQWLKTPRDREIFEAELSFMALDEEDAIYADQREAPRARPTEGKTVTLKLADREPSEYSLFDLSRGGLSVLAFFEGEFEKGDVVYITGFDDKQLDEPMKAEVKSLRPADEQGMQFKFGMMFIS